MKGLFVDSEIVLRGLRAGLARCCPQTSVDWTHASTAEQARRLARTQPFGVAVVEPDLPEAPSLARTLVDDLRIPCVLLAGEPSTNTVMTAFADRVHAYVPKGAPLGQIASAVVAVAQGERLLDRDQVRRLLAEVGPGPDVWALTGQEWRVFELMATGCSNRQIADRLDLRVGTVKNYSSRVLATLGLRRRTDAVALAARLRRRAPMPPSTPLRELAA